MDVADSTITEAILVRLDRLLSTVEVNFFVPNDAAVHGKVSFMAMNRKETQSFRRTENGWRSFYAEIARRAAGRSSSEQAQ